MNEKTASYGDSHFIQRAARNGLFHQRRRVSHLAMISKPALPVMWWAERFDSSDTDLAVKRAIRHIRMSEGAAIPGTNPPLDNANDNPYIQ